jgi:hypothetical protein
VCGPHLPRSPLHCAVGWGHLEATRLLLQAKADVQCKDKDGATPLDLARRLVTDHPSKVTAAVDLCTDISGLLLGHVNRSGNAPLAALVEAVAAQKASVS